MKILVYDPFAGISGDMNIGAMVSLGVPESYLINMVKALDLKGASLEFKKEKRMGIEGVRAVVTYEEENEHRHLKNIRDIIEKSLIPENVKIISLGIFLKLAEAEAKVHGTDISKVHFHETGAVDSIIDIICAAASVDYLQPDRIISRPPELGSGFIECMHGTFPVPPPAVSEILRDVPVSTGKVNHEATTPTGAAILKALADNFSETYHGKIRSTGYGIGKRNTSIPNVLRVLFIETEETEDTENSDEALIISCNIDDMNPELYSNVMQKLFKAGAKEVFMTPVFMKKNRPGTLLTVMATDDTETGINEILFLETTTAGLRTQRVKQKMLPRKEVLIETEYGKVRAKELYYNGKCISRKPEYEDLLSIAEKKNISLKALYSSLSI